MHFSSVISLLVVAAGFVHAVPHPKPNPQFAFVTGEGEQVFGNVGTTCQVGNEEGECDRFGRCTQFIPPNETSVLNQGREVATCTAGGPVGVIDENGDVAPL